MRAIESLPRGLALVLVAIAVARAQVQPPIANFGPPLVLRLEGVIHSDAAAGKAAGFDVASILAALRPFRPNLFVPGPPALIGALRNAPDGASVRLEGLVDRGTRTYYLREAHVTPPGS